MVHAWTARDLLGSTYREHDDGHRNGLNGGNRDNGGAANADNDHRDNRNENLSVRLVLSRKELLKIIDPLTPPYVPTNHTRDTKEISSYIT